MTDRNSDPNWNGHPDSGACAEYRERVSAAHDGERASAAQDGERVSAVHDGELVEDGAWRRHALLCESCGAFERGLPDVTAEFAALRGTPVPDLWPRLREATTRARVRSRPSVSTGLVAAAAGALATWGLLSWLAAERARDAGEPVGVQRALAAISSESAGDVELARILGTPELRLLAYLGAPKEDVR